MPRKRRPFPEGRRFGPDESSARLVPGVHRQPLDDRTSTENIASDQRGIDSRNVELVAHLRPPFARVRASEDEATGGYIVPMG